MRLKWSEAARSQYIEQLDYIAEHNLSAALKIQERVRDAVNRLLIHPHIGKVGRCEGTREFIVPKTHLVIVYIIEDENIYVANIVHMAQDYP